MRSIHVKRAGLGAFTIALVLNAIAAAEQAGGWQRSLERAARVAPDARIAVLDVQTGRLVASRRLRALAQTVAAPGSTLKPILLYQSIQQGLWSADRSVPCRKTLVIRGHSLVCSHPPAPPFNSREALAWSCNSYFAELARAIPLDRLEPMLRTAGLLEPTRLAPSESTAEFRIPQTVEDAELASLGVEGIRIAPLELAVAYRWLAQRMEADPASVATRAVLGGLSDSADFGIAVAVHSPGVSVAGKTGTAETHGSKQTHGWFVGFAPAINPEVVIVVYLPIGRGADAARVAGLALAARSMAQK